MAAKKEETKQEAVKQEVAVQETQEVATTGGFDLASLGLDASDLVDAGLTGLEDINASDISVPMGRLLGKEMGDDSDKGDFWLPLGTLGEGAKQDSGNDVHPKGVKLENVSILGIFKSRVYFEEEYDPSLANVTPTCRSTDGKVGTEGKFAGTECAKCPMSQWNDGEKAPCTQQYVLYVSVNGQRPFLMNIKGVAYGPFRKEVLPLLLERSAAVGKSIAKANKLKNVNFPICGLRLNMWSDMTTTKFGKFPYVRFELNSAKPLFNGEEIRDFNAALEAFAEMRDENISHAQIMDGQEEPAAEVKPAAPKQEEAVADLDGEAGLF